jgi:hypothetical protein
MAEILINLRNVSHIDPVKDRRGCWKRGMPVAVRDDGGSDPVPNGAEGWGVLETVPDFFRLKFPGVLTPRVRRYLDNWADLAVVETRYWITPQRIWLQIFSPAKRAIFGDDLLRHDLTNAMEALRASTPASGPTTVTVQGEPVNVTVAVVDIRRTLQRRRWRVKVESLPQVLQDKIQSAGELVIGAGGDVTWTQFRSHLLNEETGLTETDPL